MLAFRSGPVTGYSEGKTAIMNLTQALAVEWALEGVRVNAVAPGWVDTPFLDARRAKGNFDEITENVPQARLIAPAEIAEVIYFSSLRPPPPSPASLFPCDAGYIAGTGSGPAWGPAESAGLSVGERHPMGSLGSRRRRSRTCHEARSDRGNALRISGAGGCSASARRSAASISASRT